MPRRCVIYFWLVRCLPFARLHPPMRWTNVRIRARAISIESSPPRISWARVQQSCFFVFDTIRVLGLFWGHFRNFDSHATPVLKDQQQMEKLLCNMSSTSKHTSYNCLTSWESYDKIPRYIFIANLSLLISPDFVSIFLFLCLNGRIFSSFEGSIIFCVDQLNFHRAYQLCGAICYCKHNYS